MNTVAESPPTPPPALHPAGGTITAVDRDAALDFAKGGLVLCMVAYHTLNYFHHDLFLLRQLHFLPPSFIFIAGFLITSVYLPRIRRGDTSAYRRLLVRGLKLFVLFVALNVIVQTLCQTSYNRNLGLGALVGQLDTVLLTGEHRATVFGVLLPISYLLLVSAALLRIARATPYALAAIAAGTFVLCAVLERQGLLFFNLDLLSMGLLGLVAGFVGKAQLDRLGANLTALTPAYLAYALAICYWYPAYLLNTVGVTLALLLLYALGRRFANRGFLGRMVTLAGAYSLWSYLVQIAALQILFRLTRHSGALADAILTPLAVTVVITLAAVKALDYARAHSRAATRAYRFVFA